MQTFIAYRYVILSIVAYATLCNKPVSGHLLGSKLHSFKDSFKEKISSVVQDDESAVSNKEGISEFQGGFGSSTQVSENEFQSDSRSINVQSEYQISEHSTNIQYDQQTSQGVGGNDISNNQQGGYEIITNGIASGIASGYESRGYDMTQATTLNQSSSDQVINDFSKSESEEGQTYYSVDKTGIDAIDTTSTNAITELQASIRQTLDQELSNLDSKYCENFLNDDMLRRFLKQNNSDVIMATKFAVESIKWRLQMNIMGQEAPILCPLFRHGLIFEQRRNQMNEESDKPVIWIRLGSFSEAVRKYSRFTLPEAITPTIRTAKKLLRITNDKLRKFVFNREGSKPDSKWKSAVENLNLDSRALSNKPDIKLVLSSIAWWINEWDQKHPTMKATLVMDFENSASVLSSSSLSDFFMRLDNYFPDLFEKIIFYRYSHGLMSVYGHMGDFNMTLQRSALTPQSRAKVEMVENEEELRKFIASGKIKGFTDIPGHAQEHCIRETFNEPDICKTSDLQHNVTGNSFAIESIIQALNRC